MEIQDQLAQRGQQVLREQLVLLGLQGRLAQLVLREDTEDSLPSGNSTPKSLWPTPVAVM